MTDYYQSVLKFFGMKVIGGNIYTLSSGQVRRRCNFTQEMLWRGYCRCWNSDCSSWRDAAYTSLPVLESTIGGSLAPGRWRTVFHCCRYTGRGKAGIKKAAVSAAGIQAPRNPAIAAGSGLRKIKVINYRFLNVKRLRYIASDTLLSDTSNDLNKISLDRINYQLR